MHPIPRNATRIEYLESDGSQWIDTGINGQSGLVINAKFWMQRDDTNGVTFFFGCYVNASTTNRFYVGAGNRAGAGPIVQFGYNDNQLLDANEDNDFIIALNNNEALINGEEYSATASTFDNGLHMHVFGAKRSATHTVINRTMRMKSFSVSKDGVMLCDYVPVRVGNVGCVFDRVSGQFIYGSGTGNFVCGPDDVSKFAHAVKHISKDDSKPYDAEAEYIESTGTQYIDTGIEPTTDMVTKAEFTILETNGSYGVVCSYPYNDGNDYRIFENRSDSWKKIFHDRHGGRIYTNMYDSHHYVLEAGNLYMKDLTTGKTMVSGSAASGSWGSSYTTRIFFNAASEKARVYWCQFYKNGQLVGDFIPVRVGNEYCLYDRANPTGGDNGDGLYHNKGTGAFLGKDKGKVMVSRVKGKENELPYDAEVEYIENTTAGQYIDSDTTYEPGTKFQVTVKCANMSTGRAIICGNYCDNGCSFNAEFKADGSARGYVQVGGHTADMSSSALERGVGHRIIVYHQTGIALLSVNGSTVGTQTGISGTGTNANPIRFFLDYRSGTEVKGPIRLYDAQIRKDGVLVQHFIPVRVGNEYCLYDKLNPTGGDNGDGLYHNKGSGAFLGGADKPKIKPVRKHYDLPTYYTIDECNGNAPTMVNANFPSDKYDALDYTPTWEHHRFVGWYSVVFGNDNAGIEISPSDAIAYGIHDVYAHWQLPTTVTFDATTNGGSMPSGWVSPDYYEGQPYGTLPKPTKSGEMFLGWFTPDGTRITESSTVTTGILTARYTAVTWGTTYSCTTTSTYKNTGIYSANRYSESEPIVVDWGDGTSDVVDGNISQLAHTYANASTYTVRISDNISTFCPSCSDSTWYNTTSHNMYTLKKVLTLSPLVSQLSEYAFYYCSAMTDAIVPSGATSIPKYCFYNCSVLKSSSVQLPSTVASIGTYAFYLCQSSNFNSITIPASCTSIASYAFYCCYYLHPAFEAGTSTLSLGSYAFASCMYTGSAFSIDISSRRITTIPNYCFYNCRCLKAISWPQGVTSIGSSAFRYCFYYSASTGTVEIPEGVTSISGTYAFANCLYLTAVTLPSTLTNLNNYTFYYCTRLATITSNRSTAPTVSSATFGNNTTYYTGRASYSAGTNKLYVPAGATGYNASYWANVLLNSTKCGFTLEYSAYVPTSFPVGVKITRLSDNTVVYEGTLTDTSTCNTITGTAPVYVGPDNGMYVLGWSGASDGVGTFGYNATTFEILEISTAGVDVSSQYKAEWVEVTA